MPAARIIPARAGFTAPSGSRTMRNSDHPRSRGVYVSKPTERELLAGSSPLARGLRVQADRARAPRRIIPARAGFTLIHGDAISLNEGSSPLARGLRGHEGRTEPLTRIIPARAGFTDPSSTREEAKTDHPRSRGVYPGADGDVSAHFGSSPLARGLPREHLLRPEPDGIIPARAGFTGGSISRISCPTDHPRSRGVYLEEHDVEPLVEGSSPLARGLRARASRAGTQRGIIPARAGFTRRSSRTGARWPDHPRSRGVYASPRRRPRTPPGSSPLARGLQGGGSVSRADGRIIPARAGVTGTPSAVRPRTPDHPRSRGVYSFRAGQAAGAAGSSPLARGLRRHHLHHGRPRRIIPARAGFTSGPARAG